MDPINYISPILLFVGSLIGFLFGKRKQSAEVESLSVNASKVALQALLSTIEPLKGEIEELKREVNSLKDLNRQLLNENADLADSVSALRKLVQQVDDYPPFYKDMPKWYPQDNNG